AEPSRASRLRSRAGRSVFPRNVPDLDVRLLRGPLSLVPPGRPLRARGPRRSSGRFLVLDGFPGRSGRRGVGAHAGRPCRAARKSGGAGWWNRGGGPSRRLRHPAGDGRRLGRLLARAGEVRSPPRLPSRDAGPRIDEAGEGHRRAERRGRSWNDRAFRVAAGARFPAARRIAARVRLGLLAFSAVARQREPHPLRGAGPPRPGPARRGASGGRGVRVRVPRHARLADRPVLLSRNAGLTAPTVFVRTRAWTSPASAAPTRTCPRPSLNRP